MFVSASVSESQDDNDIALVDTKNMHTMTSEELPWWQRISNFFTGINPEYHKEVKRNRFMQKAHDMQKEYVVLWLRLEKMVTSFSTFGNRSYFIVLFLKGSKNGTSTGMYFELGRTEVVYVFHTPILVKKTVCMDNVETSFDWEDEFPKKHVSFVKNLSFVLFDMKSRSQVKNSDIVASGRAKLQSIIKSTGASYTLPMDLGDYYNGDLVIVPEHVHSSLLPYFVRLRIAACELKGGVKLKKTFDPFLVIQRVVQKEMHPIYVSEPCMNTYSPYWKDIVVPLYQWCNDNLNSRITFKVYDYNSSFEIYPHAYIGEVEIPTIELLNPSRIDFELYNEKNHEKVGLIQFIRVEVLDDQKKVVPEFPSKLLEIKSTQ